MKHDSVDKRTKKLVKNFDFKGLAKAHSKIEVVWHEKEWEEFIELIRLNERNRITEIVEGKKFEMNIDEYLPKVKAWKGGYDTPFDNGYSQCKTDLLNDIKEKGE